MNGQIWFVILWTCDQNAKFKDERISFHKWSSYHSCDLRLCKSAVNYTSKPPLIHSLCRPPISVAVYAQKRTSGPDKVKTKTQQSSNISKHTKIMAWIKYFYLFCHVTVSHTCVNIYICIIIISRHLHTEPEFFISWKFQIVFWYSLF